VLRRVEGEGDGGEEDHLLPLSDLAARKGYLGSVWLFLLACSSPPDPALLAAECAAGVAPSCLELGTAERNSALLTLACTGGVPEACDAVLASGTSTPARVVGLRDTMRGMPASASVARARAAASPLDAWLDYEAACWRRDASACAEAATLYRAGAAGSFEAARASGLQRLACAYGHEPACPGDGPALAVGRPTDLAPGRAAAEAACAGGSARACRVVGEVYASGARDRGRMTRDATWREAVEAARAAYAHACERGDAYACEVVPGFTGDVDDPVAALR